MGKKKVISKNKNKINRPSVDSTKKHVEPSPCEPASNIDSRTLPEDSLIDAAGNYMGRTKKTSRSA